MEKKRNQRTYSPAQVNNAFFHSRVSRNLKNERSLSAKLKPSQKRDLEEFMMNKKKVQAKTQRNFNKSHIPLTNKQGERTTDFIKLLEDYKKEQELLGNQDQVASAQLKIELLHSKLQNQQIEAIKMFQKQEVSKIEEASQKQYLDFAKAWAKIIDEYEETALQAINRLKEKNELEVQQNREKILESCEFKVSQKYKDLKKKMQIMKSAKDYSLMEVLQNQVQNLEQEEKQQFYKEVKQKLNLSERNLKSKHKQQMRALKIRLDRDRRELQKFKLADEQRILNRNQIIIKNIENKQIKEQKQIIIDKAKQQQFLKHIFSNLESPFSYDVDLDLYSNKQISQKVKMDKWESQSDKENLKENKDSNKNNSNLSKNNSGQAFKLKPSTSQEEQRNYRKQYAKNKKHKVLLYNNQIKNQTFEKKNNYRKSYSRSGFTFKQQQMIKKNQNMRKVRSSDRLFEDKNAEYEFNKWKNQKQDDFEVQRKEHKNKKIDIIAVQQKKDKNQQKVKKQNNESTYSQHLEENQSETTYERNNVRPFYNKKNFENDKKGKKLAEYYNPEDQNIQIKEQNQKFQDKNQKDKSSELNKYKDNLYQEDSNKVLVLQEDLENLQNEGENSLYDPSYNQSDSEYQEKKWKKAKKGKNERSSLKPQHQKDLNFEQSQQDKNQRKNSQKEKQTQEQVFKKQKVTEKDSQMYFQNDQNEIEQLNLVIDQINQLDQQLKQEQQLEKTQQEIYEQQKQQNQNKQQQNQESNQQKKPKSHQSKNSVDNSSSSQQTALPPINEQQSLTKKSPYMQKQVKIQQYEGLT